MSAGNLSLQAELDLFECHRKEWAAIHLGEFAVIGGSTVLGFYNEYESAFRAGVQEFGVQKRFLVKQVWVEEPVFVIY